MSGSGRVCCAGRDGREIADRQHAAAAPRRETLRDARGDAKAGESARSAPKGDGIEIGRPEPRLRQ